EFCPRPAGISVHITLETLSVISRNNQSDAREFSLASKDLPQTGLERIEFALRPPRNSRAFVDPERDKQHPKRDHYDPESRYQQDDCQQGCRD
ncbi:MAG: hypothetical protein ACP5P4_16945, partial [Steroidobacteraceae bacterium]